MRLSVVGSGYVGFSLAKLLTPKHEVLCVDVNEERVHEINKLDIKGISATTDLKQAVTNSEAAFIAVPTPQSEDGSIGLEFIKQASKDIGSALKGREGYFLVVVKSTVIPKTAEGTVVPLLEESSGKKVGGDIGVCSNPEFITQIHSSWSDDTAMKRNWSSEDKIVIGAFDERSGKFLEDIYKPTKIPIIHTNLRTAELVKYASNVCLASRVSFFNEIFLLCKELNIDSQVIADALAMDKRIGKYGTVHGKAYGGICFPKDVSAFIKFAEKYIDIPIAKATKETNDKMSKGYGVRE